MPKTKNSGSTRKLRPALSPEAQESRMISLAMDLAEQQLLDGTASSQVITHFLRIGSLEYERKIEKLEKENELLRAKADAIDDMRKQDENYQRVIDAMREYSGNGEEYD